MSSLIPFRLFTPYGLIFPIFVIASQCYQHLQFLVRHDILIYTHPFLSKAPSYHINVTGSPFAAIRRIQIFKNLMQKIIQLLRFINLMPGKMIDNINYARII